MKLYIDGEWNGYKGSLISLALVPEDRAYQEFYVEIERPSGEKLDPWVEQHVIPFLLDEPVPYRIAQRSLEAYLRRMPHPVTIVADWPEDLERFCRMLITGPGTSITYPRPLQFLVVPLESRSEVPHNALHDARANREEHARIRRVLP